MGQAAIQTGQLMRCTKFGEVPVEERGKGVMTNGEAILRLARDCDDKPALIAIAENNENTLKAAIGRYFSGRTICKKAMNTLLIRISLCAKYFLPGHDDADRWIEHCAELECRRLQNESENAFATRG